MRILDKVVHSVGPLQLRPAAGSFACCKLQLHLFGEPLQHLASKGNGTERLTDDGLQQTPQRGQGEAAW